MSLLRKIARKIFLKKRNFPRWIIERKIFPHIKSKKILIVGVAPYTSEYYRILKTNDITSIDINPYIKEFGAKKHIIGDISRMKLDEKFDFIFMIGILNYGLDYNEDAERALKNCHDLLNKEGVLILTWSPKIENHNKINPRRLKNFKLFQTVEWFGLGSGNNMGGAVFEFLMRKSFN